MSTSQDLVGGRWKIGKRLGKGGQSDVYMATDEGNNVVAVKIEPEDCPFPVLWLERKFLQFLNEGPNEVVGVPKMHYFGKYEGKDVLVMECLGTSLHDLKQSYGQNMSGACILRIAIQALDRVESIHKRGIIHRDIKPDNLLMGRENSSILYVIDFGLARKYIEGGTSNHIACRTGTRLVGTPDYASIHAHQRVELSRRDDLESLGYTFVYLFKGTLPWCDIPIEDMSMYEGNAALSASKCETRVEDLCSAMPHEMVSYFQHVRELAFEEAPNYSYLRGLFEKALKREENNNL